MKVDKLSGGEALGKSFLSHSAKFHKRCKLKLGKEKLEKVIKRHEKQYNFGNLKKHATLKGKWKFWCHPFLIMSSTRIITFCFTLMIRLAGFSLKIVGLVRNIFFGLLSSLYSSFFEILMIERSSTLVYLLLIL